MHGGLLSDRLHRGHKGGKLIDFPGKVCYLLPLFPVFVLQKKQRQGQLKSVALSAWSVFRYLLVAGRSVSAVPVRLSHFKNHGGRMPYVSIRVAGKLTKEQKQKIAQGVTDVIAEAANKPKDAVLLFIDEEARENIAKGGVLLEDM
jgi:4-oxalocrotonate tautomerase